jgi:hypothetical protein
MKTNEHIDVSDFFKRQLEGQSIEPPAYIWEQVRQNIPTYNVTSIWKNWWVYNSIAVIAILSVVVYLSYEQNINNSKKGISAKQSFTNITIRNPVVSNNQIQASIKNEVNLPTNSKNQNKISSKVQDAIYYVEFSTVGILEKVEIFDSLNNKVKIFQNIISNEFGYYELNIKDLSPGKYTIKLYKKDGGQIIREEEFR